RAVATTRRGRIYLSGSATEFFANPWLMLHEYCHVIRQWEAGTLTLARYAGEWLRHGYWNNRFEVEARAFADSHVADLHTLLARPPHSPHPRQTDGGCREERLAAPQLPQRPEPGAREVAEPAGRGLSARRGGAQHAPGPGSQGAPDTPRPRIEQEPAARCAGT